MHKLALMVPYKKVTTMNENPTNSSTFCRALQLHQKKKKKRKPLHWFQRYCVKQTFLPQNTRF